MQINPFQERAVISVRVSTKKQERGGLSLDMQIARCTEFAAENEWRVVDVIVDAASAKSIEGRIGIHRVLEMANAKQIEHVVAWNLDRLFRNTVDGLQVFAALKRKGIKVHDADNGSQIRDDTPEDRLVLTMKLGMGQFVREKISVSTKKMLADKRRRGEQTGRLTYGFRRREQVERANGKLVWLIEEDPYEQAVIARACELRRKRWSYGRICKMLFAEGYTDRQGHIHHRQNVMNWCKRRGVNIPREFIPQRGFFQSLKSTPSISTF